MSSFIAALDNRPSGKSQLDVCGMTTTKYLSKVWSGKLSIFFQPIILNMNLLIIFSNFFSKVTSFILNIK
jgi:hypothetical protein